MPQLNEEQKNSCNKSITKQEILSSIKQLTNGKIPETDVLSSDFYKFFCIDIKHLLTESILYVMKTCELSIEENRYYFPAPPPKKKIELKKKELATHKPS